MKKICFHLFCLSLGLLVVSCSGNVPMPKANLNTESDSLSYAIGISNTYGFKQRLIQNGLDSTYLDSFIKGLLEASSAKDSQQIAYLMGIQFGQQYSDESFNQFNERLFPDDEASYLNKETFMAGIVAGIREKDMKMNPEAATEFVQSTIDRIQASAAEKQYGDNKTAGAQFLEENKSKEGVVTLPSGLQYKVITEGTGPKPTLNDRVKVHYKGTLIDGTQFDSSYDRKEPTVFGVTQVVPGWTEALQLMPVGSKWEVYIPQELGYGSQDRGTIKPFSTLIFEMELLGIEPDPATAAK
ncbi:MAG: FKBP-type peptidyl-prolyl cis-trans isomerase [Candidatus Azobacteroides sp.]|nr:FKBP-type peptidyl-prolyl cis-trans isomerase [Candidatus Azobacteroides sp.]